MYDLASNGTSWEDGHFLICRITGLTTCIPDPVRQLSILTFLLSYLEAYCDEQNVDVM